MKAVAFIFESRTIRKKSSTKKVSRLLNVTIPLVHGGPRAEPVPPAQTSSHHSRFHFCRTVSLFCSSLCTLKIGPYRRKYSTAPVPDMAVKHAPVRLACVPSAQRTKGGSACVPDISSSASEDAANSQRTSTLVKGKHALQIRPFGLHGEGYLCVVSKTGRKPLLKNETWL